MAKCVRLQDVLGTLEKANIGGYITDRLMEIPAADVQPVIETEDLATATEQFICKNCGIRIENFDKVVLEEDNDGYIDKLFYEYRFKFCSECGAKVKDRIKAIKRNEPLYTMDEICKMNGVEFNPKDVIDGERAADVQLISKLIQARLRGIQKIKLEALQSSDLNIAYMMKGAEEVCNEILADVGAIIGSTI